MNQKTCLKSIIALLVHFILVSIAQAGETLFLQTPASFEKNAYSREKVRIECNLEELIPGFIKEQTSGQFSEIVLTPSLTDAGNAKFLHVKVTGVYGSGGGGWSGAKSVTLSGVLTEHGKIIGSFEGNRAAMGGPFSIGTCNMLENCAIALSKDIARWLRNPTMDAKLGELR